MITKVNNPVLDLISPSVQGALFGADINMGGNRVENAAHPPVDDFELATKKYVDQLATTTGGGVFLPAGFGPIPWAASAAVPTGWLLCDGATYSTATYPDLFAAIGYTYGGGGGIFAVPDMRGTVPAGMDNMLGSTEGPAGRITSGQADILGGFTGSQTHTLSVGEIPSHSHGGSTGSAGSHSHSGSTSTTGNHSHGGVLVPGPGVVDTTGGGGTGGNTNLAGDHSHTLTINSGGSHSHSLSISNAGGGGSHNNIQPTRFFGWIIKSTNSTIDWPGILNMGGDRIINLGTPSTSTDAATKGYVDSVAGGGALASLTDTVISGVADGDLLVYETGAWRNKVQSAVTPRYMHANAPGTFVGVSFPTDPRSETSNWLTYQGVGSVTKIISNVSQTTLTFTPTEDSGLLLFWRGTWTIIGAGALGSIGFEPGTSGPAVPGFIAGQIRMILNGGVHTNNRIRWQGFRWENFRANANGSGVKFFHYQDYPLWIASNVDGVFGSDPNWPNSFPDGTLFLSAGVTYSLDIEMSYVVETGGGAYWNTDQFGYAHRVMGQLIPVKELPYL